MNYRLLNILLLFITIASSAMGQDKNFKNEWTELVEPVYISSSSFSGKMPTGNATIKIYGIGDKKTYPADFNLHGYIVSVDGEKKKNYNITLQDAKFTMTDIKSHKIEFSGELMLHLAWNKDEKVTEVSITFGPGQLKMDRKYDTLRDNGAWQEGQGVKFNLQKEYRAQPFITLTENNINLPDRLVSREPSSEVVNDISRALKELKVTDLSFIQRYLEPGVKIDANTFPEYKEYRTVYYDAPGSNNVERFTIDSITFGVIHTPQYDVNRHNNAEYIDGKTFTAKFVNDKLIYANWNDGAGFAHFSGDTIMRQDASLLTGITFDRSRLKGRTGVNVTMVKYMEQLADSTIYNFENIYQASGLRAREYITPFGESEDLVDNTIQSIKMVEEAEKMEREFIGPDRLLSDLRGHVRSCRTTSNRNGAKDVQTEFNYEGFQTGPRVITEDISVSWDGKTLPGTHYDNVTRGNKTYQTYISRDNDRRISGLGLTCDPDYWRDYTATYKWNKDGKLQSIEINGRTFNSEDRYIYDANGNREKRRYTSSEEGIGIDGTITYTYTLFDDHGNWTERLANLRQTITDETDDFGESRESTESWVERRIINYYPMPVKNKVRGTVEVISKPVEYNDGYNY